MPAYSVATSLPIRTLTKKDFSVISNGRHSSLGMVPQTAALHYYPCQITLDASLFVNDGRRETLRFIVLARRNPKNVVNQS